ncbi:MAG: hypothetical protein AB1505_02525 [Candidatus Latescibacterota bacterium]
MPSPTAIGNRREVFWDEHLIDTARTTATLTLHRPRAEEVVLAHDAPWEGDGCDYHCILADDGLYRLYYLGYDFHDIGSTPPRPADLIKVCYAESRDGLYWEKPDLGLCDFAGSRHNNILLDHHTAQFDNFSVCRDPRPDCPAEERYKGVGSDGRDGYLWCFTSPDGIRFRQAWPMTNQGKFDTLNTAFWDRHAGCYRAYIRDFHEVPGNDLNAGIRDIRWMASDDFRTWSTPVLLDFGAAPDYPLYTNVVQPYHRADHVLVGFPSRYVERRAWTPTFDQLPGVERRRQRMNAHPRYGLAITDCVFMSSRDGRRWKRWDEAFMTPGPERERTWVYGDCYPSVGLIETPSGFPGASAELSLYAFEGHWSGAPSWLRRYTVRLDGFVSYRATYRPCAVVSRPFTFTGRRLSLNMATSAAGWIRVTLAGQGRELHSVELFGDSVDRTVVFADGEVASLAGAPVTMEITMSDADVYAFQFQDA